MEDFLLNNLLDKCEGVSIFCHIRPDGDAIGSSLGWMQVLSQHTDKPVQVYCPDVIPAKYTFLPGVERFKQVLEGTINNHLVFVLDCSDLDRLDYLKKSVWQAEEIVNIDHHTTNTNFGRYNLVDTSAAATAEIIFQLSRQYSLNIDQDASICLYAAISSDTGSFKYDNTTSTTMRIAGDLLEKDVKPSLVSQKLFDERPYTTMILLAEALKTLSFDRDNRVAWMSMDDERLNKCGSKPEELDGFVNYLRDIQEVEVGIFFYHTSEEKTKIGFRSKSVDVARIAYSFGGGGHPRAAGCTVEGHPSRVTSDVLQATYEAVKTMTITKQKQQV